MIHRRERDRGHFHHPNIELMIAVTLVAIIAAVAIPTFLKARAARGPNCLEHLLSLTAGSLPAGSSCPYSGKAYAGSPGDAVACPDAAGHLDSKPRFRRTPEGWRLEQTLSAYAGGPLEFGDGKTEVEQAEGRTTLRTWKSGIFHHVAAWIFLIALGLPALFLFGLAARLLLKAEWGAAGAVFAGAAVLAVLLALLLAAYTSRTSVVVDRAAATVTRVEHKFGRPWSTTTYAACLGVVPVPATSSGRRMLQLVHAPGADGKRTTPLEEVSADRLDLADWFNRALLP